MPNMNLNNKNNKNNNVIKNKDQNYKIYKNIKKHKEKVISKPIIIYMHPN